MKKNDTVIGICENYTYEGMGVVRVDGFPLFVKGLLVKEKALIKVVKVKKTYGYGRIQELLDESDQRCVPPCPLAKNCGGCQLQHMSYQEQLRFKQQKVQDVIDRIAKIEMAVYPVKGMERPYFYRNKAQIPFRMIDGMLHSGFYRINSNEIVDMEECRIQSPLINQIYQDIKKCFLRYPELLASLRHVLIKHAFNKEEIMVVLISRNNDHPAWKIVAEQMAQQHPQIKSVILNINERNDNVILGEKEVLLYGRDYIIDTMADYSFHISSKSFYQVNPIQTKVLYETALDACRLQGGETVLDLYCGVGTISMFLARYAKKVIGIEIVEAAIINAKANAKRNGITNIEFVCSDAAAYAKQIAGQGMRPDVVCVDPPRKGCAESVLRDIVSMHPQRIVYVSCDPGTLARDLHLLDEWGYRCEMVQPVDMFPQTYSVECVAALVKKEPM